MKIGSPAAKRYLELFRAEVDRLGSRTYSSCEADENEALVFVLNKARKPLLKKLKIAKENVDAARSARDEALQALSRAHHHEGHAKQEANEAKKEKAKIAAELAAAKTMLDAKDAEIRRLSQPLAGPYPNDRELFDIERGGDEVIPEYKYRDEWATHRMRLFQAGQLRGLAQLADSEKTRSEYKARAEKAEARIAELERACEELRALSNRLRDAREAIRSLAAALTGGEK